nr:unnamed protein product [Digitaria exilis]
MAGPMEPKGRDAAGKPLLVRVGRSGGGDSRGSASSSSITVVVGSTAVAVAGSFEFGLSIGYSSPSQLDIMRDLHLSLAEYSVFGSILTIGAMLGAIVSGSIADRAGRRGAMAISDVICTLGYLLIAFSQNYWWLDIGRVLIGCGIGLLSYVVPVYISEITPKNLRGGFATVNQFMICCGGSLAFVLGTFVTWRNLAIVGFSSGNTGTVAMAAVQVPMIGLGVLLMDKAGRRPLLMISAAGTCLGCLLVGLSFLSKEEHWERNLNVFALAGLLVFIGSFSLGMGGIPWVIMSEIFPINMKGSAGSLVTLVNWLGSWIISYAFNFLMIWSSYGTFFIFATICGLTVVFVERLVPETKGRTLEEIQASMNSSLTPFHK